MELELEQKEKLIERMSQQKEELKKENKQMIKKLNLLQNTTIKELNKKLRDRDTETDVLKEMVRST